MNASPRARILAWKICVMAMLCVPAGAGAQLVYKQFDDVGRITYSDRPDAASPTPTEAVAALDVVKALAGSTAMSSRTAVVIDANEAERRLKQAERAREQGAERLPEEQGRGANAIEMSQRYWRRQDELRRAVEQAQRRVDKTNRLLRASH
jgi:hypothetical protein